MMVLANPFISNYKFSMLKTNHRNECFPCFSSDFCHLRITFANSLDPDQARQNVGSGLDPICLTL